MLSQVYIKSDELFEWGAEQPTAVNSTKKMKEILSCTPVLQYL